LTDANQILEPEEIAVSQNKAMLRSNLSSVEPTSTDLDDMYRMRYGMPRSTGPLPRLWHRLQYFVPDVFYEAVVAKLVRKDSSWLDVECGRGLFPSNHTLARALAQNCQILVGVDPDETVENPLVHVRARSTIEEFRSDRTFDLVTMRMVAEHIREPHRALASLARLTKPDGKVVVYTVNCWSPVSLAAWLAPFMLHHPVKGFLWGTDQKDTFPVAYRMNTRARLSRLFEIHGFREAYFAYLPDCCAFYRFPYLHCFELLLWQSLKTFCIPYPENCLLAVYERVRLGGPTAV
jgi:SAM-dependent methyltransferase